MMPPTMLVPKEEMLYNVQTSPELRRMDMLNRARREEREMMLTSIDPREGMRAIATRRNSAETTTLSRLLSGLRNGLGNALISAGNRIQSAA